MQIAATVNGAWQDADVIVGYDNATLNVSSTVPYAFVRYGGSGPVNCAIVDNSTGTPLPAPPFILPLGSSSLPDRGITVSSRDESQDVACAPARLPNRLLSSAHLLRADGSFDTREYLLHGRERARAVAELEVRLCAW